MSAAKSQNGVEEYRVWLNSLALHLAQKQDRCPDTLTKPAKAGKSCSDMSLRNHKEADIPEQSLSRQVRLTLLRQPSLSRSPELAKPIPVLLG